MRNKAGVRGKARGLTSVFPLVPKHPDQTSDLEKEPFLVGRIEQETKILTLRGQSIHL